MTLLSREKVTCKQLSEKYEMSKRQIMRYIDVLIESNIPIITINGKYGGYTIDPSYKLPACFFTEEEYNRLIPAVRSYELQDATTTNIVDKLLSLSKSLRPNYLLRSAQLCVDTPLTQELQDKFAVIQNAIVTSKILNIVYHDRNGQVTERDIEPYSLLLKEGVWYVYCYCLLRDEFRFFKITRIASIIVTNKEFIERKFDENYSTALETPIVSPYVDFTFTLNQKVLSDVEEWLGIDKVKPYGKNYIAEASLPFDNVLFSKLLSFGSNITVSSPDKLIDTLKHLLSKTLVLYNK